MKTFFYNYLDYLVAVLLGGIGGAIRTIAIKRKGEKFQIWLVLSEIAIAGFAGFLVNSLLCKWGADADTKILVISIAGFTARETLEALKGFGAGVIRVLIERHEANKGGGDK